MASVFLSYDHEDSALARPIAAALEKAGHSVWVDRRIHGGAQYSRKIEEALDEADAVVVLWSPRSLESAWVRDEAAEGRDRGKLVPLRVGGVSPPMGFRQFQTINLGDWKGRGRVPAFAELLEAVTSQVQEDGAATATPPVFAAPKPLLDGPRRNWILVGVAVLLIAAVGFGAWQWLGREKLPVVEVAAANHSPRSQASANDLFVKLGSFAQVGEGKWKLVDEASAPAKPDFVFRTADTGSARQPQANLVLLDGKDDSLLWSREFTFRAGGEADLRQQMSLTAGRVLACALESRDAGGLPRDLMKLFLTACAAMAETSNEDPMTIARPLRAIVAARPRFVPAWGRLLSADANIIDMTAYGYGDQQGAIRQLKADMEKARAVAPDLPELTIAELRFVPNTAYAKRLDLLAQAVERNPESAQLFSDRNMALQGVGRMWDSVQAAKRAAQIDPLSPAAATSLIMTLAYAGRLDEARKELARAEQLWAGTGALRDAEWGFHLRFGDPAIARKYANFQTEGLNIYLTARADPSTDNIAKLADFMRKFETRAAPDDWGWGAQALGEFGLNDDLFRWIARAPTNDVAADSYLLFRPALAAARKDPRFMTLAKRIGLIDYWRSSGKWPDFCSEHSLPYDCKAEAAKYGA